MIKDFIASRDRTDIEIERIRSAIRKDAYVFICVLVIVICCFMSLVKNLGA